MGWTDPATVITLLASCVVVASAAVVFRRGAAREINHRLFWVMVYEGLFLFVLAVNLGGRWPNADGAVAVWVDVVRRFTVAVLLVVQTFYLRFLAMLRSPLVIPFRSFWGWLALGPFIAAGVAVPLLVAFQWSPPPDLLPIRWVFLVNFGPLVTVFAVALYGLAVVIDAYMRVPPGSPRRRGARSLVWAFGARDGLWVLLLALIIMGLPTAETAVPAPSDGSFAPEEPSVREVLYGFVVDLAPALISLMFIGLLTYGVLVNQMFDIDLRVKNWTRHGLWVGMTAVTFFLISESLEAVLSMGGFVPGVLAAGVAALALRPLRGVATAVVQRTFPAALESKSYQRRRKAEVYRALAEELAADGELSEDDRATLRALLERLGLSKDDLARIERGHGAGAGPKNGPSPDQSRPT